MRISMKGVSPTRKSLHSDGPGPQTRSVRSLITWLVVGCLASVVLGQTVPGYPITPNTQPWITYDWSKCHAMPGCPGVFCDPFYDMQPGGWCVSCARPTPQSYCGGAWLPWTICIMGDPSWPGNNCGAGLSGVCDPLTNVCAVNEPIPGSPALFCAQLQCSRGSSTTPGGIDP